jgi:hypothetical protein
MACAVILRQHFETTAQAKSGKCAQTEVVSIVKSRLWERGGERGAKWWQEWQESLGMRYGGRVEQGRAGHEDPGSASVIFTL